MMTRDQLIQLLGLEAGVIAHVDMDAMRAHPVFELPTANAKALRSDLRNDTRSHLRTMTDVKTSSDFLPNDVDGLSGVAKVEASSLAQAVKFHVAPNGAWAINFEIAGRTVQDLAASLDMAAAQFAAMDAHAVAQKWIGLG